ncbi:Kef-type K+ transport system membrane component KefB [Dysgonomonas alginatilytica]|uniref:Kef-type K+ transport system membrane component KefB n=1 Tax=Dysgonomonas alginatilytica TaxID=1605892 RepID=A0A2V3PPM4_9BACT|nr:cation:proton antiporter [Dysgonomonas alginatilytica]PXV63173.1 Kef-type K+ transport system membrane component KefB [Dysgonomonas alginatilytica]
MSKHKNLIFYISIVGVLSIVIYFVLSLGQNQLAVSLDGNEVVNGYSAWSNFSTSVLEEATGSTALLILQIIVILCFVRLFGWICQKIGQPTVIGEIIAGIVLGPSLLGAFFPEMSNLIFPASSIGSIKLLSEIGLILFMFIVGMELDLKVLKNRANDAILISHSCIAILFTFGTVFSYFIYPYFSHPDGHFVSFALFMGIAMSITAFPVLARIVHERGLNKTPLGAMVITCAAVDDITAWCLLAAVIAIAKAGTFVSSLYVIFFAVVYVVLMFKLVRPFLQRIADLQTSKNIISKSIIGIFFLVLFLSSYLTSIIGIHPLFGAFLAGVIMPPNINFRKLFIDKIEDISLVILLPLFFVYTGLNTRIGLLNDGSLWMICGIIILLATIGKLVGGTLVSRFIGFDWKSSMTIGALMNTRGLMELVVLNIGYDLGILTPEVFAMMVVMALVTTFMTSPLLDLIDRIFKNRVPENSITERKIYKILAPFKNIELGEKLLLIANSFVKKSQNYSEINMVHFTPGNNLYQYNIEDEERDTFEPILEKARELGQPVNTMFEVASEPFAKIVKLSNDGDYDLLLIGAHYSIYQGNLLGQFLGLSTKLLRFPAHLFSFLKKNKRVTNRDVLSLGDGTHSVLKNSNLSVGIFIDRGLTEIKNVIVPILDEDDIFVGDFMERLTQNSYVRITLWDAIGLMDKSIEFVKSVRGIKAVNPYLFQLWNNNIPIDVDIFKKHDLLMVSLKSWKNLRERYPSWEKDVPSTLILND